MDARYEVGVHESLPDKLTGPALAALSGATLLIAAGNEKLWIAASRVST